ncbi:copper fist DNA-binding domain containing protein [Grosmannia clavigera kw1407]|uniref:Copper fist DNA-binding domain containing protein n=1 Tax=Grosmannia clavigera (strain kw1407 / UAMH 11150) TaxID=655863 RepID=F0X9M5_GROCL|nr:copper fist DNA-binding domain containing protein [Grosmannia clavigera kw1407]EFX05811.1 copper fist DNA-binding domain containing protein [Grosmannia clavigera kw1407]
MLINGEKWACDACVRGHRVSNCQHYERPLQHINKKGRPVTQCQHCRSQRKNRSAHVKCDCGEKTTKCVHLGAIDGHRESCCCNHGGRCSCSFKKDPDSSSSDMTEKGSAAAKTASAATMSTTASSLGTSGLSSPKSPIRRRRANTTRSEGTLTFDEHGRHKPVSHKHAKSQKTSPYPSSRINSVRSTGVLSNLMAASKSANNEDEAEEDDHSSGLGESDSGADDGGGFLSMTTPASTTATSVPLSFHATEHQEQRLSRSETTSPLHLDSSYPQPHQLNDNSQLPPLNMGAVDYISYNYNAFDSPDQPLFSAGLKAPAVDWNQFFGANSANGISGGNAGNESGKFGNTGPFGFGSTFGYEYNGSEQAPTMTTATSGEVSEAEDLMVPGVDDYDYDYDGATDAASSSVAFSRANSSYHLASSVNIRHDFSDMRLNKAGNKFLPTPSAATTDDAAALAAVGAMAHGATLEDDDAAIWMPDYQGLTSMTESPESDVISFWGSK